MSSKETIVQTILERVIGDVVSYKIRYSNRKQPIGPFPIRYVKRKEYDDGGTAIKVYGNYFYVTSTNPSGIFVRKCSEYQGEIGLEKFLRFVVEEMGVEISNIKIPHNLNCITSASELPTHYVIDVDEIYTPRILFGWNFNTKVTNWYCTCGEGPNKIPKQYHEEFVVFVAPWAHEFYITTNLKYRHPHVFEGGKVCVGNLNFEYLSEDKFYAARYIASNILSHVNFASLANDVSSEAKFYEFLAETCCPQCGRNPISINCPVCGEPIDEEHLCDVCGLSVCEDCIYYAELDDVYYCGGCAENYVDCRYCGRTGYYEDMRRVESLDEWLCSSCYEEHIFYCKFCDRDHNKLYVWRYSCTKCGEDVCDSKVVKVGQKLYCPTCHESCFVECPVCGVEYDAEEEEFVCEHCCEAMCDECKWYHECQEEEEFYDEE